MIFRERIFKVEQVAFYRESQLNFINFLNISLW